MENGVITLLEDNFTLTARDKEILDKNTGQLNRSERYYYFQELKPREKEFKEYLKEIAYTSNSRELRDMVVDSLLARKGDPSIADGLLMDILGRLEIYRELRKKAGEQGVKLKALTNFGGMGMVITLFGVLTAIVLYFLAR